MLQELALYRRSNAITVVSKNDKANLPEDIAQKTFIIPHRQNETSIFTKRPYNKIVGYLSNWQHDPNIVSIRWYIDNVWSKVLAIDPEVKLYLFGYDPANVTKEFTKTKNVFYAGFVDTVANIFANCDITISPMVVGAGMNGKIIDSINYRVPCVMVDRAGDALELKSLVSDDLDEQAMMVCRLLNDDEYYQQMAKQQSIELDVSYGYNVFWKNVNEMFAFLKMPLNGVK
jgi:hypothetical protein